MAPYTLSLYFNFNLGRIVPENWDIQHWEHCTDHQSVQSVAGKVSCCSAAPAPKLWKRKAPSLSLPDAKEIFLIIINYYYLLLLLLLLIKWKSRHRCRCNFVMSAHTLPPTSNNNLLTYIVNAIYTCVRDNQIRKWQIQLQTRLHITCYCQFSCERLIAEW